MHTLCNSHILTGLSDKHVSIRLHAGLSRTTRQNSRVMFLTGTIEESFKQCTRKLL